jgi:hypothetical protein
MIWKDVILFNIFTPQNKFNIMNNTRRKQIQKCIDQIENIKETLTLLQEEEQEAFENLPEGIQDSDRGSIMEQSADAIDNSLDLLEQSISYAQEAIQ